MDYRGMTVAEIDMEIATLKDARKVALKVEKDEADLAIRAKIAEHSEGDFVTVIFKGEKVEAIFGKLTEKRFTVEIDGVKKSIMFDKYVG